MPLHITAYHCVYYGATDEFDERLHQPSNDDKFNIIWLGVFSKKGQKLETTCVTGCHLSIHLYLSAYLSRLSLLAVAAAARTSQTIPLISPVD